MLNMAAIVLMTIVIIVLVGLSIFIKAETAKDIIWISSLVIIPVCVIFIILCIITIAGWNLHPDIMALEALFGKN